MVLGLDRLRVCTLLCRVRWRTVRLSGWLRPCSVFDARNLELRRKPIWKSPTGFPGLWWGLGGEARGRRADEPNALCQTGVAEFPAIALANAEYEDLAMVASFKPISGKEDQAAGLIFRVQDEDNYYIVRANALEDNVGIYKYVDGRRSEMESESVRLDPGEWRELRVEVTGDQIRAFLDKREVVEATDDEFTSGGVGLWTKADSVTCFDNVSTET